MPADPAEARPLQGLKDFVVALLGRYDSALMEPPPAAPCAAIGTEAERRLRAWCLANAGDGRSPLWRPWQRPQVTQRLAAAVLVCAPRTDPPALVTRLMLDIDGSHRLEAVGGRTAELALRLRVKLQELMWWRARRDDDPWDSGLVSDSAVVRNRAGPFRPRRATLLVLQRPTADFVAFMWAALSAQSAAYRHPVRLLVVAGDGAAAGLVDAAVFTVAAMPWLK
jgi:hypothetical protein